MNVFDLAAKITLDTSEYKKGLNEAESDTKSFASRLGGAAATIGKAAATTLATGAAALGTAAVNITKSAVQSYGEYEQLVGGVETLFKDSADIVQDYAANAYKTAGLSANQYMETVTSFAASLLQSLGGDTEAAAKYADTAVTDMADNANKMGTNIQSIQNAYQGFAKQNYTLLDNLKLGYGGTKGEMERLVLDAEKLNSSFKATRDENGNLAMSYADIVDAIHIVQQNMGITGTTAAEAADTIQGSAGSMKAAWQNLVTGLADGNADIGQLIDEFLTSLSAVAKNLIPIIQKALSGVIQLAQEFVQKAPELIDQFMPTITNGVLSIIKSINTALPELFKTGGKMIGTLISGIIGVLPEIVTTAFAIINDLVIGVGEALPELIPAAMDIVMTLIEQITSPESLGKFVDATLAITVGLVNGLIDAIPVLLKAVPVIISNLVQAIVENLPKINTAALEITNALAEMLTDPETLEIIIMAAVDIIEALIKGIAQLLPTLALMAVDIVNALASSIGNSVGMLKDKGQDVVNRIKDGIFSKIQDAKNWGKDLIDNFIGGITEKWNNLKNTVSNVAGTIKNFLGFSEPSEGPLSNFHTYAPDMMKLYAEGIRDNVDIVEDQLNRSLDFDFQNGAGMQRQSAGSTSKNLTIVLEVDKQRFAKAVVDLGRLEEQRQGTVLFSV